MEDVRRGTGSGGNFGAAVEGRRVGRRSLFLRRGQGRGRVLEARAGLLHGGRGGLRAIQGGVLLLALGRGGGRRHLV